MQIHEITFRSKRQLDEALPNWMDPAVIAQKAQAVGQGIKTVGQNIKSTVAPAQQAYQARVQSKAQGSASNKAVAAWTNYAKQLKAANPDPARYATLYKQTLQAFVQKNLLRGQPLANAVNKQEISQLIDAITAAESNPQQVSQLFSKLVQQAAVSVTDTTSGPGQLMVRVINSDPAVLQFRNKTYIINDQGDWAEKDSGKVADQSFQAFLDQELAKAAPNAQQQLNPQPQTQEKIEYLPADPQWKNLDGVRGYQGKIWLKDKAGKWFNYNNNSPVEETRPAYIDKLNDLYAQVQPKTTPAPATTPGATPSTVSAPGTSAQTKPTNKRKTSP